MTFTTPNEEEDVTGREHDERRKAQAAAARKFRNRSKFSKATRNEWKKGN